MHLKPLAAVLSVLSGLCSGVAQATLIVPTYTTTYDGASNLNNVTLTLASSVAFPSSPTDISVEDIRGTAAISNTATSSFDLLYSGAAPLPNSLLLSLNSTLSQEVLLSFDLLPSELAFQAPFYTGDVIAAATGLAVGTVTDPSLTPFLGTTFYVFTYEANYSNPGAGLLSYGLSAVLPSAAPVPEPASVFLASCGIMLLLTIVVRVKRTKQTSRCL